MASELPPEQHASYSAIIDSILASADLNTISAKRIRKGLQEQVDYDITPQKAAITDLIMLRFDKFQRSSPTITSADAVPEPAPTTNGTTAVKPTAKVKPTIEVKPEASPSEPPTSPTKRKASASASEDEMSYIIDTSSPPPKKAKKSAPKPTKAETDEEIAKRMQAEINAPSARSTRGGGPKVKKSKAVVKKTPTKKKKSKAKLNSDDDSDLEGSDKSQKPPKEKKGGFHKPMLLSQPLSDMLGESSLSRPQTVKKIWEYVKARDLQDPADKRQIRCDEAMQKVFKQERVHMFTMNKLLATQLYPADEYGAAS